MAKKNIRIVNYPQGNIILVSNKQLKKLESQGVVRWDEDYNQYGFEEEDLRKVKSVLKKVS